jgi:excisionase family DNA binding protein
MAEKMWLNTREVARLLDVNEKVVYTLISEKGLPATKVTGKWLFPRHLVEHWLENQTVNYPKTADPAPQFNDLLVLTGSDDILLNQAISLFNRLYPDNLAVFGNLGSLGGIRSLRRGLSHIASSHLLQESEGEYNFGVAIDELGQPPAVVNFCRREQGLLLLNDNPKNIQNAADLTAQGVKIVNRPLGTGTRLLFEKQLQDSDISPDQIDGFQNEVARHLDVGLEVMSGRADAGPGIRAVAGLLGLDFISWGWERFDLLILKDRFFEEGVQLFLGMLREPSFTDLIKDLEGYDMSTCGKMIYPQEAEDSE